MAYMELNFHSDVIASASIGVIIPQKANNLANKKLDNIPTLFLLHDMGEDYTAWVRRTSVERYAEQYGIAVVMPTAFKSWYTDMYYGPAIRTYIGTELPKICRRFFANLSDKREDTYIAGAFMGGYGALAIALVYPETFSFAASLSAEFNVKNLYHPENPDDTLFIDAFGKIENFDGSDNNLYKLINQRKAEAAKLPQVYIACRTQDKTLCENKKMYEYLKEANYDVLYAERNDSDIMTFRDSEIRQVFACISKRYKKEY